MNAEHARPMMAYVALCLTASYVLGQGVLGSQSATGSLEIARAGEPARAIAKAVTMTAADGILTAGVGLVTGPIQGVVDVAASLSNSGPVRQVSDAVAATAPNRAPQSVGSAPTLSPAPQVATHGKAAAAQRKSVRTAERSASRGTGSPKADRPAKGKSAKRGK